VSLRAPFELQQGGFAWFPITTPLRPSAEDVRVATDAVWEWLDNRVDSDVPLIVIGFSQGGLMASQLLRTRPERLRHTVVLAGFATDIPQPADDELVTRRPGLLWTRGAADAIISPDAIDRTRDVFNRLTSLDERTYPGLGHSVDERVLADVRNYLGGS
jgi:phospholipase/carboxylesterase